MSLEALFESSFEFDESVRVDRGASGDDPEKKLSLVKKYHVTTSAEAYLSDLMARILGEAEGKRKGANHWLYGYYGSGKSHLLAVTGLLLNSEWVSKVGQNAAWTALAEGDDLGELRSLWERCLGEYKLQPLFVNLLKEQGSRERGFGNVILRRLHEQQGLSPHLKTAFFEQWYLKNHSEEQLKERAERVLRDAGADLPGDNAWEKVQKYRVLADGALPALFEDATGTREGYTDVTERRLNASTVAKRIEDARQGIETRSGRPARLLLLLDEITLFIGTQYGLLTELNALAEAIDEVGGGKILTVGTAQEDPSRVQTEYSAREVDFSILADRFPSQYSLPSSHVGEIVQNRLLRKTDRGEKEFERALSESELSPGDSLVFRNVQQNTDPPLDEMLGAAVRSCLPLLPYQPPLFLQILSNLRTEDANRAKSIFSGTARAVLAIADGLLESWDASTSELGHGKDGDPTRVVSLVDFFEVIRPELEDIVPQDVETIEEVEERVQDGELKPIDEKVCKVVLLLQRVPDMIPLDDTKNIAVGIMDDLDGPNVYKMDNLVDESLRRRLGKYIRTDEEAASHRRFTNREERAVLEDAERREERFGAAEIVEEMTIPTGMFGAAGSNSLWSEVLRHLDLPRQVPYEEEGDPYPVEYAFDIDGHATGPVFGESGALRAEVHVEGLVSGEERALSEHGDVFLWRLGEEGRESLYDDLRQWAALSAACRDHTTPQTIEQALRRQGEDLPSRIAARIRSATLKVRGHDPSDVAEGVKTYVRKTTPSAFHPEMLFVDESRLGELEGIRRKENLPAWAEKIDVVCDSQSAIVDDITTEVYSTIGRALKQDGTLSITNAIGRLQEEEEAYEDVGPALVAHLWGLSKRGDFQPVSEEGSPRDAGDLLDPSRWHEVRLRLGQDSSLRDILEDVPTVDQTDTLNEAIVKARSFIEDQRRRADTLRDRIKAAKENAATEPVERLLGGLFEWLAQTRDQVERWLKKTRTEDSNWESVIQGVLRVQGQFGAAETQWESRESYLLQLDGLLLLQDRYGETIGEEAAGALSTLCEEARVATDTLWWTEDGWTELIDRLNAHSDATGALEKWWNETRHREEVETLMEKTRDHPWLVSPRKLPLDWLGRTFRRKYLGPVRNVRTKIERAENVLRPFMQDAHDLQTGDVQRSLGRLRSGADLELPTDEEIEQHRTRLQVLETLTGGAGPEETGAIGLWPEDEKALKIPLSRVAQSGEMPSIDDAKHGVIITPDT